jgi:hypothetical protein
MWGASNQAGKPCTDLECFGLYRFISLEEVRERQKKYDRRRSRNAEQFLFRQEAGIPEGWMPK